MDEEEIRQYQQRRETFLTLFLSLLAGSAVVFCLILVTGGFFLYVLLGGAAVAIGGYFHYLMWGKGFSDNVAGEREELEVRSRAEEEEEEDVPPAHKRPNSHA